MSNIAYKYKFKRTIVLRLEHDAKIVIVDFGMGNLGSIKNMFNAIGMEALVTRDVEKIKKAQKIILPGVGSFDQGIINLHTMKLFSVLKDLIKNKRIPTLGICLGMQLLTEKSEEGKLKGFGLIKAETRKFSLSKGLKVPHMGWNNIKILKKHPLIDGLDSNARFYFVHSYHVVLKDKKDGLMTTNYGEDFISAFAKGNIMGVQFHPEKSHRFGMELLKNFGSKL